MMASQSSLPQNFPRDTLKIAKSKSPREQTMKRAFTLQSSLIKKIDLHIMKDLGIHPFYPLSKLLIWRDSFFMSKQLSYFYWYLASAYTIAVEVQTVALQTNLHSYLEKEDFQPAHQIQIEMVQWFKPLSWWNDTLEIEWRKIKGISPCDIVGLRSEHFANPLKC